MPKTKYLSSHTAAKDTNKHHPHSAQYASIYGKIEIVPNVVLVVFEWLEYTKTFYKNTLFK